MKERIEKAVASLPCLGRIDGEVGINAFCFTSELIEGTTRGSSKIQRVVSKEPHSYASRKCSEQRGQRADTCEINER